MADDPSAEWPDSYYHIGQRDHLHALGVITASYNQLEFTLFVFFMRYLQIAPDPAQRLFVLLANPNRIALLRDAVTSNEKDLTIKEMVLYFIAGFEILADSRNFLAHSHTILNKPDQDHLTFGKGSKRQPGLWSFAHMTLKDLRRIANDIKAFWLYGSHLDAWIVARTTGGSLDFGGGNVHVPLLPKKPPQPAKLMSGPDGVLE